GRIGGGTPPSREIWRLPADASRPPRCSSLFFGNRCQSAGDGADELTGGRGSVKIPRLDRKVAKQRRKIGQALRDHVQHVAFALQLAAHLEQARFEQGLALRR